MAAQAGAGMETILKKPAQQGFILGQSHHAIAKVTGWQDAVFATQAPRTAAIIRDGYYRGKIPYRVVGIPLLVRSSVSFQAAQQCGKSRAAADGDDPYWLNALKR